MDISQCIDQPLFGKPFFFLISINIIIFVVITEDERFKNSKCLGRNYYEMSIKLQSSWHDLEIY